MNTDPGTQDLKALRESRVLTQAQLGSQGHVSAYENGKRMPGPAAIRAMAAVLGVEPTVVYAACLESVRRASAVQVSPKRRARVAGGR